MISPAVTEDDARDGRLLANADKARDEYFAARSPATPPASVQIARALVAIDRSQTGLGVSGSLVQDLGRFVYQNGPAVVAALKAAEARELAFPFQWRLRAGLSAVLRELLEQEGVPAERVRELNGSPAVARRVIFDLRAKLRTVAPGVAIESAPWDGYYIVPMAKDRLRAAIAAAR